MLTIENNEASVIVACDGRLLLRYQAVTHASKPHFDVVAIPPTAQPVPHVGRPLPESTENIVLACPHDHPWHLGLFFTPGELDGLNFWGAERARHNVEPHGEARSTGRVKTSIRDDGAVEFSHEIEWQALLPPSSGEVVVWMREHRAIVVPPPREHAYRMDWVIALTATAGDRRCSSVRENIRRVSQDDPPEVGGQVLGSPRSPDGSATEGLEVAGLAYRSPRSMSDRGGGLFNSERGSSPRAVPGRPGPRCGFTGKPGGCCRRRHAHQAGVALMDHPQNPGYPNAFSATTSPFGLLALNPAFGRSLTIKHDDPITLRFGVLIHYGEPDRERIELEYQRFVQPGR